jgi:hypothetical protein
MGDDDDDDRLERWMTANGVAKIGYRTTSDGRRTMIYYRADGTEVTKDNQYGYDEFTPFTPTSGKA